VLNYNSLTLEGTITGQVDGAVNLQGSILVPNTGILNFNSTSNINWLGGTLEGGGTLINQSQFSFNGGGAKTITGNTTFSNPSVLISEAGSGTIVISNGGVLQNESTGVYDILDGQFMTGDGLFNNIGLIRKTASFNTATFNAPFHNIGGTIQVETGILGLNNPNHRLTNGIYNVFSGATFNWGVTASGIEPVGTLSGTIDGEMNWSNQLYVNDIVNFDFSGTGDFNWKSGTLRGGGTLINNSVLKLNSVASKLIDENTILSNNETIELQESTLSITSGSLQNQASGILDHQAGIISGAGELVNFGLLTKTLGAQNRTIINPFHNNGGTIQIETGFLGLNNLDNVFTNGVYNVSVGAVFDWGVASRAVEVSGMLLGTIDGEMNWNNRLIVPTTARFDFNGSGNFNWQAGNLEGGGTLTLASNMNISNSGVVGIIEGTTLNNEGNLNIFKAFNISEGTIFNTTIGSIIINNNVGYLQGGSGPNRLIVNEGYLQKIGVVTYSFSSEFNNSGVIEISEGTLNFTGTLPFNNLESGIVKGIGTLELPLNNNYTNLGTFAPGASPGSLTIIGDFITSATSVLDIELDGATQGVDYDVLNIDGTASLEGYMQVTLSYAPNLSDEFIVLTTTSNITNCGLPTTAEASFNNTDYQFSVACVDDNKLILTVEEILSAGDEELLASSITLFPNPVKTALTIKNLNNLRIDKIELYDLSGRLVSNYVFNETFIMKEIPLDYLYDGIYLVKLFSNTSTLTTKIIKS
jgi:hypothetical protein